MFPFCSCLHNIFSDFPRFWWLWQFRGTLFRCFVEYPSISIFCSFSYNKAESVHFGRRPQSGVPFSTQSIEGTCCQYELLLLLLTLIIWLKLGVRVSPLSMAEYFVCLSPLVLFPSHISRQQHHQIPLYPLIASVYHVVTGCHSAMEVRD
jgi:hypothetical protein